jgi:hypothetical protein
MHSTKLAARKLRQYPFSAANTSQIWPIKNIYSTNYKIHQRKCISGETGQSVSMGVWRSCGWGVTAAQLLVGCLAAGTRGRRCSGVIWVDGSEVVWTGRRRPRSWALRLLAPVVGEAGRVGKDGWLAAGEVVWRDGCSACSWRQRPV